MVVNHAREDKTLKTPQTIHLLKVSQNGQHVSWACVPFIRLTGYLGPIGKHATQDPARVTCETCREEVQA